MLLLLPPLAAETLFTINNFPVSNSLINSSIAVVLFAILAFFVNRGIKKYYSQPIAPKAFINFCEWVIETLFGYFDQVTGDRKKTIKFLPIVGSFFFFILISNWMGLLPGTGSLGIYGLHHGKVELIPLLRPANADLNTTLGLAIFAVIASHILGIMAIGFFKYANKFIKLGDIYKAFISFNPVKILVAVIEFFVGFIEVFSEVAKMVSLSLRLYGNIFAGEVLLTVIASLIQGYGAFGIPLPFIALELIVGIVQATVFSMLTLVYLTIATAEIHSHEADGEAHTH
jgi:F-type H+-transporting ATPase subunit a